MPKGYYRIICLLTVLFLFGCANKSGILLNERAFIPVRVEFGGTYQDAATEKLIRESLFCESCLFVETSFGPVSYSMKIEYSRIIDPKSLGLVLLTGAMASVEAEFRYGVVISFWKEDRKVQEYIFSRKQIEKTDSALDGILNPFHTTNSKAEKVFKDFMEKFIQDFLKDSPPASLPDSRS